MIPPPSGVQHHLTSGDQEAVIAEVGASLRCYRAGGIDAVRPYRQDQIAPVFAGQVMGPWPNRLADGRYRYRERVYQVPLTEPERANALHGFFPTVRFEDTEPSSDQTRVRLTHDLVPTAGYPWPLRVTTTFELTDDGLRATITATNLGDAPAPYGCGAHPWLSTGGASVDACTLEVGATRHVFPDGRLLPARIGPVNGDYDLRSPAGLAGRAYDDAWTGLVRDADGRSWVRLGRPDGHTVEVWADEAATAWQVCTGDHVPELGRVAVATEPMTCVANAFCTGADVVHLAPGASHTLTWGIALR